jgi:hypothetical protein
MMPAHERDCAIARSSAAIKRTPKNIVMKVEEPSITLRIVCPTLVMAYFGLS